MSILFNPFIHVNRPKLALNWLALWNLLVCVNMHKGYLLLTLWKYTKRMCYKWLWRSNKKSLFPFKNNPTRGIVKECASRYALGLHRKKSLNWGVVKCFLCNKDIQVMYTRVYLGWNLQDQIILATFHWLSSSCIWHSANDLEVTLKNVVG